MNRADDLLQLTRQSVAQLLTHLFTAIQLDASQERAARLIAARKATGAPLKYMTLWLNLPAPPLRRYGDLREIMDEAIALNEALSTASPNDTRILQQAQQLLASVDKSLAENGVPSPPLTID